LARDTTAKYAVIHYLRYGIIGHSVQYVDIPPPQSAAVGLLHQVAGKLLLISRPAEGRRLSWPGHTVS